MTSSTATLLLRLTGPMQSWGTQSRFSIRDTGLEPSKSGVIGILCAALGRLRGESIDDLAALSMGVRVDREGVMKVDFHTAGGWHRRSAVGYGVPLPGGKGHRTVLSDRYYLADADFLVGLEGERELLEQIDAALRRPRWQIFLGRKSFVPATPVRLPDTPPWGPGLRDQSLMTALSDVPWLGHLDPRQNDRVPESLRLTMEPTTGMAGEVLTDTPLSFAERRFTTRYVMTARVGLSELPPAPEGGPDVSLASDAESA